MGKFKKASFYPGFWFVLWALQTLDGFSATIDSVRSYRSPDHTRIVFDASASLEHKIFTLENPYRIVIDLKDTQWKADLDSIDFSKTPVSDYRTAIYDNSDQRIVLVLKNKIQPKSFLLKPNAQYGYRLVVDLYDSKKPAAKKVTPSRGSSRLMVVAIDAGHGGEDPGASGKKGSREKDIVLQIAREVAKLMEQEAGLKPFLVRDGDYYLSLKQRPASARKEKDADMFISIHADAFKDARAKGVSVFALSRKGATSATASYLAKKENLSDLIGGVEVDDQSDVRSVLADMTMEGSLEHSLYLGGFILNEFGGFARLHKKQVEQAGFRVLKEPEMISVLIETGFISNPGEEKLLTSKRYQKKIARAILEGVKEYYAQYPVPGSWFADQKVRQRSQLVYRVQRGDTLSAIAKRYKISVRDLKRMNNLKTDVVVLGKKLKVPRV